MSRSRRARALWWLLLVALCLLALAADAGPALAAQPVHAVAESTQVLAQGSNGINEIKSVLTNLRNWVMGVLAVLATVMLTFGGVRYLMAGGDPGEVDAAKRCFKGAGVGYALAALAPIFTSALLSIVGQAE